MDVAGGSLPLSVSRSPSATVAAEYHARLTTAADAMSRVPNGSALAMGLSPCQPPALLAALAARAKARNIEGIRVYYSVSGRHLRNTILRFEHLRRFEPHCLFFGATRNAHVS